MTDDSARERIMYELAEAQSEIARHHADFERVRAVLSLHERLTSDEKFVSSKGDLIRDLRRVVG